MRRSNKHEHLPCVPIPAGEAATLVGIEQEYQVADRGGSIDFRRLVHSLGLGWPYLDPADHNAYRVASGAAVTADETEAEIALPPVACVPGFTRRIARHAQAERDRLQFLLRNTVRVSGWSTHVSVSSKRTMDERVALAYSRTFAPALMLLMDRPSSPGLLVRPRLGRIELGGEFVDGLRLRAVLAFAVGSVLACRRAFEVGRAPRPPALSLRLQRDDRRFGWFVGRCAFGPDLYRDGRRAQLFQANGATTTAQQHLEVCWEIARDALAGLACDDDLVACDRMVSGTLPLAVEDGDLPADTRPVGADEAPSAYGQVLGVRQRGAFEMAPVLVNWHLCVFLIADAARTRRAFACVPRPYLESFVAQIDAGGMDDAIEAYLRTRPRGRILSRRGQAQAPALFDELGPRAGLLPLEWDTRYKQLRRRLVSYLLQLRFDRTGASPVRRWRFGIGTRGVLRKNDWERMMSDPKPLDRDAKEIAKRDAQKQALVGRPGKQGQATSATSGRIKMGISAAALAVIIAGTYVGTQGGVGTPATGSTGTAVPTTAPTAIPTTPPTPVPTTPPTPVPTTPPTPVPTTPPTAVPTTPPTAVPTTPPTAVPTTPPTAVPTRAPTPVPTAVPTAVPTTPPAVPAANTARGQDVYGALGCGGCHGPNAKGGPAGKDVPAAGTELMQTRIRQGQGRMPAFGPDRLSEADLQHLIAYLLGLR